MLKIKNRGKKYDIIKNIYKAWYKEINKRKLSMTKGVLSLISSYYCSHRVQIDLSHIRTTCGT